MRWLDPSCLNPDTGVSWSRCCRRPHCCILSRLGVFGLLWIPGLQLLQGRPDPWACCLKRTLLGVAAQDKMPSCYFYNRSIGGMPLKSTLHLCACRAECLKNWLHSCAREQKDISPLQMHTCQGLGGGKGCPLVRRGTARQWVRQPQHRSPPPTSLGACRFGKGKLLSAGVFSKMKF